MSTQTENNVRTSVAAPGRETGRVVSCACGGGRAEGLGPRAEGTESGHEHGEDVERFDEFTGGGVGDRPLGPRPPALGPSSDPRPSDALRAAIGAQRLSVSVAVAGAHLDRVMREARELQVMLQRLGWTAETAPMGEACGRAEGKAEAMMDDGRATFLAVGMKSGGQESAWFNQDFLVQEGLGFGDVVRVLRVRRGLSVPDLWDRLNKPCWQVPALENMERAAECTLTRESAMELLSVLASEKPLTVDEAMAWARATGLDPRVVKFEGITRASRRQGLGRSVSAGEVERAYGHGREREDAGARGSDGAGDGDVCCEQPGGGGGGDGAGAGVCACVGKRAAGAGLAAGGEGVARGVAGR